MVNEVEVIKEIERACWRLSDFALGVSANVERWAELRLPRGKQRYGGDSHEVREGATSFETKLKELVVRVEIIRAGYKNVVGKDILQ